MVKQYKNDIFEVIKHLDNKDYGYYDSLTDEQKKDIQPYTLMRWLSTASGNEEIHKLMTILVNENVNKDFWQMSKYKDLQWKLLCTCGLKKWMRHQWIPMSKSNNDKEYKTIRAFYKDLNEQDFAIRYKALTKDDKENIFRYLGLKDK